MHVEEYVNGKKRQMVKISGTEDEFDELGLEPHQKYKTKKGEQRVSVSLPADDDSGLVDEARAFVEERSRRVKFESMRQWTMEYEGNLSMEYFLTWLPTSKKPFMLPELTGKGLTREEARSLMKMALKDHWTEADGKLTDFGRTESDLCLQMLEMMR